MVKNWQKKTKISSYFQYKKISNSVLRTTRRYTKDTTFTLIYQRYKICFASKRRNFVIKSILISCFVYTFENHLHSCLSAFMSTPAPITMRGKFRRATRWSRGVSYCALKPKSPPFYKMSPRVFSSLNNTKMAFLNVYKVQQTFVCCYPFLYVMMELMLKFNILKKSEFHENYDDVWFTATLK